MPRRFPKPFFRRDRGKDRGWFVQVGKQQIKLADGPKNAATKAAAVTRYHEVMAEHGKRQQLGSATAAEPLVVEIFDRYQDWCQKHREPRTAEWYHDHIQSFIDSLPNATSMTLTSLKPFHVVEWVDKHSDWSPAYRRGAIVAIQRPFNWAAKIGYIAASPIPYIEKPQSQRREQVVSPETFAKMRDHYAEGDPFRDLIEYAWETGCRPQEVTRIEARHVRLDQKRVEFPPAEAKGKKHLRIIRLTDRATAIVIRLLAERRQGRLFRNEDGQPWTRFAINCRFCRLKKHLGEKFAAYSLRHGFGTRKLVEGHDALTVAQLMGHRDSRMLEKVYQHLDRHEDHLRKALNNDD